MAADKLVGVVFSLIIIAIAIAMSTKMITEIGSGATANSALANATTEGLAGMTTFADMLPTMAIIVVVVVIIGFLLMLTKYKNL